MLANEITSAANGWTALVLFISAGSAAWTAYISWKRSDDAFRLKMLEKESEQTKQQLANCQKQVAEQEKQIIEQHAKIEQLLRDVASSNQVNESMRRHLSGACKLLESFLIEINDHDTLGIMIVDGQSKIIGVNHTIAAFLGYTEPELFGQSIGVIIPERFRSAHDSYLANALQGEWLVDRPQMTLPVLRKDNSEIACSIRVVGWGETAKDRRFVGLVRALP